MPVGYGLLSQVLSAVTHWRSQNIVQRRRAAYLLRFANVILLAKCMQAGDNQQVLCVVGGLFVCLHYIFLKCVPLQTLTNSMTHCCEMWDCVRLF